MHIPLTMQMRRALAAYRAAVAALKMERAGSPEEGSCPPGCRPKGGGKGLRRALKAGREEDCRKSRTELLAVGRTDALAAGRTEPGEKDDDR